MLRILSLLTKLPVWVYLAVAAAGLLGIWIKQREATAVAQFKLELAQASTDSLALLADSLETSLRKVENERIQQRARLDTVAQASEDTARRMGLGVDSLLSELRLHAPKSLEPVVVALGDKISQERAAFQAALAARSGTILSLEGSLRDRDILLTSKDRLIAAFEAERAIRAQLTGPKKAGGFIHSLVLPAGTGLATYAITGEIDKAIVVGGVTLLLERVF